MSNIKILFLFCFLALSLHGFSQQSAAQDKPKFGYFQCRADAQKWTYDPFDKTLSPKFTNGTAILVNGQFRVLPHISYGVTAGQLVERIYEMSVCRGEDEEFQKKFNTYATLEDSYREERTFRYMSFLTKHNLDKQFVKEDAEDFK
ncbi:MAG: hypothetical protein WDN23_17475 [Edaphobacter sp.]